MSGQGASRARRILALVVPLSLLAAATMEVPAVAATSYPPPAQVSQADAAREAAVVAAEDARLTEVRTVSSLARWQNKNWKTPYRLSTGSGYTLVLTPSNSAYTVSQLQVLAPQTFVQMSDGSYLLSENIAVMAGATLALSAPGGLKLRMASGSSGFATIVSFGGKIMLAGDAPDPVSVTSWDIHAGAADTNVTDGRAYIRAIGGQFLMTYTTLTSLGFWAGRTGGLALTGTSRPNTGAVESSAKAKRTDNGVPTVTGSLGANPITPVGTLPKGATDPRLKFTVPNMDYVSIQIANSTITGDAFGMFISGADGVQVTDTVVQNSLIAGIELHRFVSSGAIERTTSIHNAGDGFNLDRATEGILISEARATDNAGSGFVISGRPLSTGPSATGASLDSYGNNSVSNSSATGNAHDGIEVVGGFNVGVQNNQVSHNDMGIVVTNAATKVSVTGNEVDHITRHGIALINGVTSSAVTGNQVTGAPTGIYVRDSVADVKGNTVEGATMHGVTVVGHSAHTVVANNVLSGRGLSALDSSRSFGGVTTSENINNGWHDTSPWYVKAKVLLHPMTLLWGTLLLLILVSAVRSRKRNDDIVHPYAHQMGHAMEVTVPAPRDIDLRDPADLQGVE
ncbi:hypothetical protein acdb102_19590 [Acidothermaceae bacterium B102]|nr:hypothetical protein acdb102_19590 [Acidothermaceae bacterium B102]